MAEVLRRRSQQRGCHRWGADARGRFADHTKVRRMCWRPTRVTC